MSVTTSESIKFCPSCKDILHENQKLAQGVKECKSCGTKFFILLTSIKSK